MPGFTPSDDLTVEGLRIVCPIAYLVLPYFLILNSCGYIIVCCYFIVLCIQFLEDITLIKRGVVVFWWASFRYSLFRYFKQYCWIWFYHRGVILRTFFKVLQEPLIGNHKDGDMKIYRSMAGIIDVKALKNFPHDHRHFTTAE